MPPTQHPPARAYAAGMLLGLGLATVLAMGCSAGVTSRAGLAARGITAIQQHNMQTYAPHLLQLPELREHCSPRELHRLQQTLPRVHERLGPAIAQCRELAAWSEAQLVGLSGGDVVEQPRECQGFLSRVTPIVATYTIGHRSFTVHHRRPYRLRDGRLVVGRELWCARN